MIQWPVDSFSDQFFSNEIYTGKDRKFIDLAISVFVRDSFTCKFCMFKCDPTTEVPNAFFQVKALDNNYRNLVRDNLVTSCPFCHSHFNIRAAFRSGNYIPIRHSQLRPTTLSIISKSILVELGSKNNSLYDSAMSFYRELEGFGSNITLPDFTTIHLTSEDAGERAKKARTAFILNIIALSDGGGYSSQTKVALLDIHPLPRWNAFTAMSDFYEKNAFSKIRKSPSLMKIYASM